MIDKPLAGMDVRKSKMESLFCQAGTQYEEQEVEARGRRGTVVVRQNWPLFGQTPQALVRDPKIPAQAKALYSLYHTYCQTKELPDSPDTFVQQKTLAENMGWHYNSVYHYQKVLEETGWITVKHRGLNKSNLIILHGRRRRVRNGRTEE